MRMGLSLGLTTVRGASGPAVLPTTALVLDYDVADAVLSAGDIDTLPNTGSLSTDALTHLTYQFGRPVYTASDSDFNNKPSASALNAALALRSDGVFAAAVAQPFTVYLVHRVYGATTNTMFWSLARTGSLANSAGLRTTGTSGFVTSNATALSPTVPTGVHLTCIVYNGASSAVYIDDMTTAVTSGDADSASCESFFIGSYLGQEADVAYKWARRLQYAAAHSQAQREAVQAFTLQEYGV